jgi:hypothetical protein
VIEKSVGFIVFTLLSGSAAQLSVIAQMRRDIVCLQPTRTAATGHLLPDDSLPAQRLRAATSSH